MLTDFQKCPTLVYEVTVPSVAQSFLRGQLAYMGAAGLPHAAVSLGVAVLSAAITVSWMAQAMWVPLATAALVCGAYLSAHKLVGSRATTAAATEGGTE